MPLWPVDGIDGGSFEGACAVTARRAGSVASFSAGCSELEYEQLLLAEAEVLARAGPSPSPNPSPNPNPNPDPAPDPDPDPSPNPNPDPSPSPSPSPNQVLASCGPELIDRMWARVIATEFARAPVVKLDHERDLTAMDLSVLVVEDNPFQQQAISAVLQIYSARHPSVTFTTEI